MQKLFDDGISSRRGIMTSHRETAYKDSSADLALPISEDACDRSIIIPLYIPMEQKDIDLVIEKLRFHLTA
jgi:perosamine synthetase